MYKCKIYCPGGTLSESGIASQSGVATKDRYPEAKILSSGDNIAAIESCISANAGPYVVPIWNSHQGSIPYSSFIWRKIEDEKIKIYDLWAKEIEFCLVARKETKEIKHIISVGVAKMQCSDFLKDYEFSEEKLTTTAFESFERSPHLHGVLIAPQSSLSDQYAVVKQNTANDNNFTTFINFYGSDDWLCRQSRHLTAITTSRLSADLNAEERVLFDNMFEGIDDIGRAPRLIFVFDLLDKVGLLFEGDKISQGDLLNAEEIIGSDISIYEEVGTIETLYSEQLKNFIEETYPDFAQGEFLVHKGTKAYLFACPSLGIFTHGYSREATEPVFKFYMHKVFEALHNGAHGTSEQIAFYQKHKAAWNAAPLNFMKFTEI